MNFWERNDAPSDNWQDKLGEYANKSQDELMGELLATANRMKGAGTLTARELDDFYGRVEGFLNDEQKARMRSLIEMLKR